MEKLAKITIKCDYLMWKKFKVAAKYNSEDAKTVLERYMLEYANRLYDDKEFREALPQRGSSMVLRQGRKMHLTIIF